MALRIELLRSKAQNTEQFKQTIHTDYSGETPDEWEYGDIFINGSLISKSWSIKPPKGWRVIGPVRYSPHPQLEVKRGNEMMPDPLGHIYVSVVCKLIKGTHDYQPEPSFWVEYDIVPVK